MIFYIIKYAEDSFVMDYCSLSLLCDNELQQEVRFY